MKPWKVLGIPIGKKQTTRIKVNVEALIDVPFGITGEPTQEQLETWAGCEITEEIAYRIGQGREVVDLKIDGEVLGEAPDNEKYGD